MVSSVDICAAIEPYLNRPGTDIYALAERTGTSASHLYKIRRGTAVKLSAELFFSLSRELHISVDELAGAGSKLEITGSSPAVNIRAKQVLNAVFQATKRLAPEFGLDVGIQEILEWWTSTGGLLTECDRLAPYFDLFEIPDSNSFMPHVHRVGSLGLSRQALESSEPSALQAFIESLKKDEIADISAKIRRLPEAKEGIISSRRRAVVPGNGHPAFDVAFVNVLLPVFDSSGTVYGLSYSGEPKTSLVNRNSG